MQKTVFDDPFIFFNKERWDHRRRRYALGIFFIFLVSATWVVSSVISQFLYTERSFDSPFLVTYLGICLFSFLLPFKWCTNKIGITKDTTTSTSCITQCCDVMDFGSNNGTNNNTNSKSSNAACATMNNGPTVLGDSISVVTEYENMVQLEKDNRRMIKKQSKKREALERRKRISDALAGRPIPISIEQQQQQQPTVAIVNADGTPITVDDTTTKNKKTLKISNSIITNSKSDVGGGGDMEEDDAITVSSQYSASVSTVFSLNHPGRNWNHSKHIFVAMHIAPVLFIANWLFSASLQATSVVSATVLVSTSGMFVFLLGILAKEETFHILKLIGVILGIFGTVLTARHDFNAQDEYDQYSDTENCTTDKCDYNLWGDLLALLAAIAFASYAVQVRLLCPMDEEIYSMSLLLGYIGIFITVPLLPLAIYLMTKIEITMEIFVLILLRGLFDYVISEYLHFRSVVLTNATIATVGLGLTIPMAFIADFISGKANVASPSSLIGALCVAAGFIFVNIADGDDEHHHGGHGSSNNTTDNYENDGVMMNNQPSGEELLANGIPMNIIHQQSITTNPAYKSKVVL